MKISYNWLKNYLQVDIPASQVAEILTDGGLEVEGVDEIQPIEGGLDGLVIGEVIEKQKHPDADKLSCTLVNIGGPEPLPIVCGATNVAKGQKVLVAMVGCTLYPTDGEPFKIKKSKIRGEVSEGMICAEDEIGLGASHDGIMILDSSAMPGTSAATYFKLESDFVFEIGLTPNRADAMSHYGVARDLAALLNQHKIEHGGLHLPDISKFKTSNFSSPISISVKNEEACPRYIGMYIKGVKVMSSPEWLQNKLRAIGSKPINNVVDITNYVLHELGQPLHAFDAAHISGNEVVIQNRPENEVFVTLDGVERKLNGSDLMICNANEGMCIAGVFGGQKSGVTESTTNVFLESAYFNPTHIRKTAKRHALNTDASFRFERGVDPNITLFAAKRAAQLIQEIAGGEIAENITDVYSSPIDGFETKLRYAYCNKFIGKAIAKDEIKRIITDLEIKITAESEEELSLWVPPYKVDVQREIDVIEEILRVHGYNNIEFPEKLQFALLNNRGDQVEKVKNIALNFLASNGFNEMMHNSLTKASYYQASDGWNPENAIEILNPLSNDLGILRQTMLYHGLEAIQYNQNRSENNLRLLEFGRSYHQYPDKREEIEHVALYMVGRFMPESWNSIPDQSSYFHLKGILESLMSRLGIDGPGLVWKEGRSPLFEAATELFIANKKVAELGLVSSKLQKKFDLRQPVVFADINWTQVLSMLHFNKVKYKEVPRFPMVQRDLALLVSQQTKFQDILDLAYKTERKLLKQVSLFDRYEGKGLEPGTKSYGVRFEFRHPEKTLKDADIDGIMKKIYAQLQNSLGASLRAGEI
ncbi:MAG: phenylalanine--tRNA ligase subunit beta [Flavobacteriales bacterium]|nr:phenylalanine--tRNA ligase subunit beta [Flavobacteriales bacterium]